MYMANPKTPGSVLLALLPEYHLNPFSLSKKIGLSSSAVRQIIIGKSRISVGTALRLAKFFGQTSAFWLDLQREADFKEAEKDKKLQRVLEGISRAKKPSAAEAKAAKAKPKAKSRRTKKAKSGVKPRKKLTLADKRKKAAKVPGSKTAARKRKAK